MSVGAGRSAALTKGVPLPVLYMHVALDVLVEGLRGSILVQCTALHFVNTKDNGSSCI